MTSRKLWIAVAVLLPIHILALCPGFFSPYDPDVQNRNLPFAPPTRLLWIDGDGTVHLRPFVYPWKALPGRVAVYEPDTSHPAPLRFFIHHTEQPQAGSTHSHWHLFGTEDDVPIFLLGSDQYGRDQLSRMLYGIQMSLLAGLTAAAVAVSLGLLVGLIAGFYGGVVDGILMRLGELFFALPWLYVLFALRALLPLNTSPQESVLLFTLVISTVGWVRPARLIRGAVLSLKERNYVLAARGFGASDVHILRRHVLPQTFGIALTQAGLLIPHFILAEVTLSYLGLGAGEPVPSLGKLLAEIHVQSIASSQWWMLLPAVVLVPLLAGYYGLADALHQRAGLVQV